MSTYQRTGNEAVVMIDIGADVFAAGVNRAYNEVKGRVNLPGFRKGKVTRQVLDKVLGKSFLHEEAINDILPDMYKEAIKEHGFTPVSRPRAEIVSADDKEGASVEVFVTVKPDITLGDYKGLHYKKVETEVTDEELEDEIRRERERNARVVGVVDRAIQDGDIAVINFEGFADGEPFEGGKSTNYRLDIGSKTFIDTFEQQLIGLSKGDDKEVHVTFPDDYASPHLAGKPALFKVHVNEIEAKELPEPDDEFAQDISEFETFEEYKDDLRVRLGESKSEHADHEREERVCESLLERAEIDLPRVMIDDEIDAMINEFARGLEYQNIDFDSYCRYTGITKAGMRRTNEPTAEKRVRARLALEAVALRENVDITEDEFEEELLHAAGVYHMGRDEFLEAIGESGREDVEWDVKRKKALDILVQYAVED